MSRTTIDFGIDLGTTNSAVAVLQGTRAEIIKNNEESDCTPSVVWIDKKERLHVGQAAKNSLFHDPDNAVAEFKLKMGKVAPFSFNRGGRRMLPEELSAEVLKSLRASVKQRTGEEIDSAVVTIPADFDLPQNAATNKAAQLAGFAQCPLLQEPVAAALAYGFQSTSEKVFWFVFDFGGGTFDAAVVQVVDGQIQVVNHGGDKMLGGKLIDWEIVDTLLAPAVTDEFRLRDFRRGNPRWNAAFAKLKAEAEKAKIQLSGGAQSIEILIDYLCQDEKGQAVRLEREITRSEIEKVVSPFLERSINISRRVLAEKSLTPGMIEKLILVGGPTFTPLFRSRLAQELAIPLEFGIDPMTVVARGAAIFAGTQRLDRKAQAAHPAGAATLDLVYEPIVKEAEPSVGGKVILAGAKSPAGFTIEFVNAGSEPPWRSGKTLLDDGGAFLSPLWADEGKRNLFTIELRDPAGTLVQTSPDRIEVTIGNKPGAAPLTHSIGVAMANGQTDFFIRKGSSLPVSKRMVHKNVEPVKRGSTGQVLHIPFVEGESPNAERNRLIGYLDIPAAGMPRDLPAQSEIEISIKIDASRQVLTRAFIGVIDKEFEKVLDLTKNQVVDLKVLDRKVQAARARLAEVRARAEAPMGSASGAVAGGRKAADILARIDREGMEHDVDASHRAAANDPEAADKCQLRLLDLEIALDELEQAIQWPSLLRQAEDALEQAGTIVEKHGRRRQDRETAAALERETRAAIASGDPALLKAKIASLDRFWFDIASEQPEFWVQQLRWLEGQRDSLSDPGKADGLFLQGRRAAEANDLEAMKGAVNQLWRLLPDEKKASSPLGGGTMR